MNADHCSYNMKDKRLECQHCSSQEPIVMPQALQSFAKNCGDFADKHRQCKKKEIKTP
jgi:hypothetical protein